MGVSCRIFKDKIKNTEEGHIYAKRKMKKTVVFIVADQ
jgi:hypothetical protein